MALTVPGRRTVTVIRRVRRTDGDGWARGRGGAAIYDEVREDVAGCSVQPSTGQEADENGRVQASALTTIYAPPSWPGGLIDAVEIGGVRHDIEGRPQRVEHPRLGHVVVTVKEASG